MVNKLRVRDPGVTFEPDFVGLSTKDRFLVGFGLDYDYAEYMRNLPESTLLQEKISKKLCLFFKPAYTLRGQSPSDRAKREESRFYPYEKLHRVKTFLRGVSGDDFLN